MRRPLLETYKKSPDRVEKPNPDLDVAINYRSVAPGVLSAPGRLNLRVEQTHNPLLEPYDEVVAVGLYFSGFVV